MFGWGSETTSILMSPWLTLLMVHHQILQPYIGEPSLLKTKYFTFLI